MQQNMTDAQLDHAAKVHAVSNGVSYAQALDSVVQMAAYPVASFSQGLAVSSDPAIDESKIHTAAMHYAASKNVGYLQALNVVLAMRNQQATGFSELQQLNAATGSDAQLHSAAMVHMHTHRVSYFDAISAVVTVMPQDASAYSEAPQPSQSTSTDAQLDAAAQRYASAHSVSYFEALGAVTTGASSYAEASGAAAALENQSIEIFKAGVHTDMAGIGREYTVNDVKATAKAYSAAKHEAPLVLGHPDHDKPAYGWVKGLQATDDGRLMMAVSQVDSAFAEGVKDGRYRKRSVQFYPPTNPGNPVPGVWYVKHVGWLGAMPPAVKGLADASFGASLNDCFTFATS